MKYLERVGLVGAVHTILIALIPYGTIVFKWNSDNEMVITQFILLTAIICISIFTLLFTKRRVTNYARVEGFAWGYFYNFLYETADLIQDQDATIKFKGQTVVTAKNDKVEDLDYSEKDAIDEIMLLIIVPKDLHAQYRLAELISSLFDQAVISPGIRSYYSMRQKHLKGHSFDREGSRYLLLIDTPPTTMRAIKLYEESCCNIDHNDAFEQLDAKSRKQFNKICLLGRRKIAPIFKKSLDNIILSLTKGSKRHTYSDLIKIISLDELISGIIEPIEYEALEGIGDNLSKTSISTKTRVGKMVMARKEKLLARMENLAYNTFTFKR